MSSSTGLSIRIMAQRIESFIHIHSIRKLDTENDSVGF